MSILVFDDADNLAEAIVRDVGPKIVLALPLGLGKANHVANALFARAAADKSVELSIFTALTLEKPHGGSEFERRFIGPVMERLFGGYPGLSYTEALLAGSLPPNIEVNEFFFLAGRWLQVPTAQQHYISANYTHAGRYVLERGVNVIAQLVAKRGEGNDARHSLSCNPDLTLDLLRARAEGRANFKLIGQTNSELPFMPGEAVLADDAFSHILEGSDFPLYAPPNAPLGLTEYALGLRIAGLVPDGGTLQIGIGQEGDAAAQGLILRHRENAAFREMTAALRVLPSRLQDHAPFRQGLYGLSEMFSAAFLALIEAGIIRREIDGAILHAAFFLGPKEFYRALREMPEAELSRLRMTSVQFTNALYGDEENKRRARTNARFINNAMMATLLGAVISDGLEDGRVVSGVGGQHDFVTQAFALDGARAIIAVKATRHAQGRTHSNILWCYGHQTIPRHLRDIIVTEYGVADLRGKSDREVIAAMLSVADSRFQDELLRQAKDAGKIEKEFEIPAAQRDNFPERIAQALSPFRARGLLPIFPFGTDFTPAEQALMPALQALRTASMPQLLRLLLQGFVAGRRSEDEACLARMGYDHPQTLRDRFYAALLCGALTQ
jgi:acyl-CoA hydrolase